MIPLATTSVVIERLQDGVDPYEDEDAWMPIATGVPGHISSPTGQERAIGGEQSEIDAVLLADTLELQHTDRITDERGDTYRVTWVRYRVGLGLDHTVAGLKVFEGASSG